MKKMLVVLMVFGLLVAFSGFVFAQSETRHKNFIDFGDMLIEGTIKSPGVDLTTGHVEKKFVPVLPVRKNFEKEAKKSLETLK